MFPAARTPLSTRLRRGFDLAVQFATLGEYGVALEEPVRPHRAPRRPPPGSWRPPRRAIEVAPATAAARRRAEPPRRLSTPAEVRSLALSPPAERAPARPR